MVNHSCTQEGKISAIEQQITTIFNNQKKDEAWKVRIEDKIDKILWFFLGQTFTALIGIIVFVVNHR